MGNASPGSDFRESIDARYSGDGCWTSILFPDSASSSFWWKFRPEDSSLGVSYLLFSSKIIPDIYYSACLADEVISNLVSWGKLL